MKKIILIGIVLVSGMIAGGVLSPIFAQQQFAAPQQITCFVGGGSNAACSGKWTFFAGNTSNIDGGAWVVRIDNETGAIWYKNGKKLVLLAEPN